MPRGQLYLPHPSLLPCPASITPTAEETKTLSTFGNLIENKSRKTGKTEGGEEREETELTSRERFDRFTHYVANIYGTTNGLTDKRGAWPGVDRVEGLRTGFRVVARASSSTTRRVVKFEFATAKWATTTTKRNETKRVTRQAKGQRSL